MADDLSEEELKRLKREAAIRAKEGDYLKKKADEEEAKRQQLAELKEEYERAEERKIFEQLKALKRQTELRAQRKAEREKLTNKREEKIVARQEDWSQRANMKIHQTVEEHKAQQDREAQALEEARARKREKEVLAAEERLKVKERQQEIEAQREKKIEERALQTELRAIQRADALKAEATEELTSFIHHPYPVPLKQVLAGRLRPVPRVTELLASYKDQREGLEDLKGENIALRAIIRNESLFQHVLGMKKDFEAHRIKPPEPVAADLVGGKGPRGGSPKKRGNETQSMGGTAMSWKSTSNSPMRRSNNARSTR